MRLRNVVIILGLALLAAGPLAAQETTGRIEGASWTAQSLPCPGVTVTATGPQGEKTRDYGYGRPLHSSFLDAGPLPTAGGTSRISRPSSRTT